MTLERTFQGKLIKKIRDQYPGAVILKNDPNYLQGFPDLIILFRNQFALLEDKADENSPRQPNQEYYIQEFSKWTLSRFIYPENEKEVLRELQDTFRSSR